jgi:hypothetical protein
MVSVALVGTMAIVKTMGIIVGMESMGIIIATWSHSIFSFSG